MTVSPPSGITLDVDVVSIVLQASFKVCITIPIIDSPVQSLNLVH